MAKMRISLWVLFFLCFFTAEVFGSGDSTSDSASDQTKNLNLVPSLAEHLEGILKYFKALEEKNVEQEKVNVELKEQFKSLREEMNQLKAQVVQDHGVSFLMAPLRGRPGQKGDAGANGKDGQTGAKGEPGQKGEKGDEGLIGSTSKPAEVQISATFSPTPGPKGETGLTDSKFTSCSDAMKLLPSPQSTKQRIYPDGKSKRVDVLCDFETDGGAWTVIQKRSSGPRDEFNRTWDEYTNGFGSVDGNFWLGLENIRALTKNGDQELRIELEDFAGNKKYAKYSSFSVSDASDFYRLSVSGVSGDAGDSMTSSEKSWTNNGMQFSTKDKDNDKYGASFNCANYHGGWWLNSCGYSLNGFYLGNGESTTGIRWHTWKSENLAKTEIKIRQRK